MLFVNICFSYLGRAGESDISIEALPDFEISAFSLRVCTIDIYKVRYVHSIKFHNSVQQLNTFTVGCKSCQDKQIEQAQIQIALPNIKKIKFSN